MALSTSRVNAGEAFVNAKCANECRIKKGDSRRKTEERKPETERGKMKTENRKPKAVSKLYALRPKLI